MAERVHPSSKPPPPASTRPLPFPPTKSQTFARPVYRPQPPPKRRRRSCCCSCFLYSILALIIILLLLAAASAVFYFVYRPRPPKFSVFSLRLSSFNVSNTNKLTSNLDVSLTASNPNKKLVYIYDPSTVYVSTDEIGVGDGAFPRFVLDTKNRTVLRTTIANRGSPLDAAAAKKLRGKNKLALDVVVEGKAAVKVGSAKTSKVKVRITCTGFTVNVPKGKSPPAMATSPDGKCNVKLRIKIWKWYL